MRGASTLAHAIISHESDNGILDIDRVSTGEGGGGGSQHNISRILKESSSMGVCPMLMRMNCFQWALLMQINLEVMEVWDAIDPGASSARPIISQWVLSSAAFPRRCGRKRQLRRRGRL